MNSNQLIISESPRPKWQIPIAALFFTAATYFIILIIFNVVWNDKTIRDIGLLFKFVVYLSVFGTSFCFQKSVHIDLKKSRFRSTFEIGPVKLGQWKTISSYEYVSVFHQPLENGHKIYEVNLWYDTNKHWELYEEYNPKEAFRIGFELSELLDIDLLDATTPNDYKWMDKEVLRKQLEKVS
ncbi:hypothetical protein [Mangrovimonas sp. DI 80]|uniref:hypothetical protein n=1 Tax=Mangrovimonas sp. DI 80 TaxID=1779330 RepID=UPI000975F673|nr:hypothetical protein [Mangrovimonas sp. DI 80]OMP32521.1 hypothetical protein BKM32_05605 [Mangrovimonas sp. DI 80]